MWQRNENEGAPTPWACWFSDIRKASKAQCDINVSKGLFYAAQDVFEQTI